MKPILLLLTLVFSGILGFLLGGAQGSKVALESWAIFLEVAVLATWPIRKAKAGSEGVNLTKNRMQRRLMIGGGISTFIGALWGLLEPGEVLSGRILEGAVLLLSAIFFLEAHIPTRLTEKGLLQFGRFLPWSSVGAYSWHGRSLFLWASSEAFLPWWGMSWVHQRSMGVSVAEVDRREVISLLEQRLPEREVDDALRRLLGAGGDPEPEIALHVQAEVRAELRDGNDAGALRAIRKGIDASEYQAQSVLNRIRKRETGTLASRLPGETDG